MRDMLEARKRGDFAFRDKDFKTAIDCYSQVFFNTSLFIVSVISNYYDYLAVKLLTLFT